MSAELTQKNRSIAITTPLGEDKLVLLRFSYAEALNRTFTLVAHMLSTDQSIPFDQIVGHPVSVRMDLAKGDKRYFHGIVSEFVQAGRQVGTAEYRATIVPWFKHLGNAADCQIFQNETVPEIVSKVIKKAGYTDLELSLTETYPPLEFCVQYRETTLNFVSRLLERAGICYYFRHEEARHVMVLTDSVSKHKPAAGYESVPYREAQTTGSKIESIHNWTLSKRALTGKCALSDFDFKRPKTDLIVNVPVSRAHGLANFEQFDYPGEYVESENGKFFAKARLQSIQSTHEVVNGESSCRALAAGSTFKLQDHARDDQNREYLLASVGFSFNAGGFGSGTAEDAGSSAPAFECSFSALPTTQQFRPSRSIEEPTVHGPQTAIVTGPKGEEIHTDEHGRVKVHFHWDRYGKYDADSSCWVRVSQLWAGKGWGGMHIPRVGQEVIVEFLEGDPDRPIITGRVYNGEAKPPYDLPAEKTKSTIKSNSSKGGGGFNELRFEDKKGEEQVYIHAEKDKEVRVKHDSIEWVGNESHLVVKKDQMEQVEGDKHLTVKGDQNEKVDGGVSLKTGGDLQQKIGGKHAVDVAGQIHLKAGSTLVIEAGTTITLKAGGAFITIGPAGVSISGNPVLINSGGSAGSGSGASPDAAKAPRDAVDATAGKVDAPGVGSPAAAALKQASKDGAPFCEQCEAAARA